MSREAVLALGRDADGTLRAVVLPIHGSDDLEVRELAPLRHETAVVHIGDERRTIEVFYEGDAIWARYDDVLSP